MMLEYQGVKITWLGHDCFKLKDGKTILIDPYKLSSGVERADIVLITHEHFDHLSPEDIMKVVTEETTIVATPSCRSELQKLKLQKLRIVSPGDIVDLDGVTVEVVPAYNLNKFREPGKVFHPKADGKAGYVVTMKGVRIYHAGDTDAIPEMKGLKADLALLPVSGTYVMTAQEAAEAAKMISPKLAIPMHYGAIVGSAQDAESFKRLAPCPVQILQSE